MAQWVQRIGAMSLLKVMGGPAYATPEQALTTKHTKDTKGTIDRIDRALGVSFASLVSLVSFVFLILLRNPAAPRTGAVALASPPTASATDCSSSRTSY